jgi:hypothetical protein
MATKKKTARKHRVMKNPRRADYDRARNTHPIEMGVTYQGGAWRELDTLLEKTARLSNGLAVGSGYDFTSQTRDVQLVFNTRMDRVVFLDALRVIGSVFATVYEPEDDAP